MHLTLTALRQTDRKVGTMSQLRRVGSRPDGAPLSLGDARDIVLAVEDGQPQTVDADPPALADWFEFDRPTGADIPRDLVLAFVFDALSFLDPRSARALMSETSYANLKAAL